MATKWDPTKFDLDLKHVNTFIPINDLDHLLLPTNTNSGIKNVNNRLFADFVFISWAEKEEISDFFNGEDVSEWSNDDIISIFKDFYHSDPIAIDRSPRGGVLFCVNEFKNDF
jgi:hypothetical protein